MPLSTRYSKVDIEKTYICDKKLKPIEDNKEYFDNIAKEIINAKKNNASVICAFGAHTIKNGMGYLLGQFIENGWLSHLATNGAGVIHDWEFAYQGLSSEDVRQNVKIGQFGTWQETGRYINLAITVGAFNDLGYGESIGKLIIDDGLNIPSNIEIESIISDKNMPFSKRAAALDLSDEINKLNLERGFLEIKHPFKKYSIQAKALELDIPFTSHPMFGHDIIYTNPALNGAAIGRTAERDFLSYVNSVSNLQNGVYLSVGSAVMSPMIFEKSISMSRNVGKQIDNCKIHVIDLQKSTWDWSKGEPPIDTPDYYLRFMKSFHRMNCPVEYTMMDNTKFFSGLYQSLKELDNV
jgi:hypothetical protein